MIMVRYGDYGDRCLFCLWNELVPQRMSPVLAQYEVVFVPRLVCAKCQRRKT